MRVPISWLADYVDLDMTTDQLAHRLTMIGLKVESIERPSEGWEDVLIGQVVEIHPHPTSNKPLHVATVNAGEKSVTVVTGAQNVGLGDKAPIVLVGGSIPYGPDGEPLVIQRRPMAGITSEGMLASARELGISDEHEGIYILPADAPVGQPLASIWSGDVLDIETNPNRPDTLSIVGIAREVAAMTEQQVTLPDVEILGDTVTFIDEQSIPVDVLAPDLCPRYTALRIEGVRNGSSPTWMQSRLEAAGMRPISLLVDITNYVMLEVGQPMHAFDASRLAGERIVIRRAEEGERMCTLDGVERILSPENLVIADADRAVAVAGVMGGENSEISEETTTVILESATFDPVSVRRTAKALGLRTEASMRFEKDLPPENAPIAAWRFVQLLAQITGSNLRVAAMTDVWVGPEEPRIVDMPLDDISRLIGITVPTDDVAEILSLLGFDVAIEADTVRATVPYWRRVDIEMSADLVEEVARLVGFDKVPATLPRRTMEAAPPLPERHWDGVVRERLLSGGINEVETHSLVSPGFLARLFKETVGSTEGAWDVLIPDWEGIQRAGATAAPPRLSNPATRDRQILRVTLLASLLDVVARNLKHTNERISFFEMDRTFFWRSEEELPYERRTLAIALSGNRRPRTWADPAPGPHTFYDIKGVVEAVLDALHIQGATVAPYRHPSLHPGRSASLNLGDTQVAYFGELHPEVAARFEIEGWPVQVAEIDLDALFPCASGPAGFSTLPRFPAAYRDIAVVVRRDVPAADVIGVVERAGGDLLEAARIFDVYTGEPLPRDRKSVAVEMVFRGAEGTLTQEDVSAAVDGIVGALRDTVGASLRD